MDDIAKTSDGTRQLRAFFSPPRMTQADMAKALGISQQAVSMWVTGRSRPSAHQRAAIERIAGIPAASWLTPEERQHVENAGESVRRNGTEV